MSTLRTACQHNIWLNYNDLTATSLEIMVNKGNHPQMALIQVGEILYIIYPDNMCFLSPSNYGFVLKWDTPASVNGLP